MPDRLKECEQEILRLNKVNQVLMERVERSIDKSGSDYGLFEHNILLQKHVEARTAELEKLQSQLLQAQKMESVGILAGGVAHDFNNLLQVMRGNIELLTRNISNDPQSKARLQAVTRSLDRAATLVQQLLLFSRKADSDKVQVDVNQEVREAFRMLERTIPKMISLELNLAPKLGPISGDPALIEQVLLNLTNNAVDAMPQGGRLIIETSIVEPDQGFVKRCPDAADRPHVLLSVTDTGSGMDAATLEHVFDPFFTTKEAGRGTGLGLASVYGIVKGHGGDIQCYSEPGRGTTFRIYLPVMEQAHETPMDRQPDTPLQGGDETILVVDDEAEIRELTQEVLEGLDYKVLTVEDGEQAIKIYQEQGGQIHLILLDLNMPGMGGYNCLQKLLQLNPSVKVVIASGYSANGQAGEALSSGARGFVGKPYQMKELAKTVRGVLDGKEETK
ncbi:MAG: response regulator [Desulfonatronovibrio sp.]